MVVIFDRLPLERLSIRPEHRLLDGPQIRTSMDSARPVIRRLAAVEDRMYRRVALPDHLVLLDVDPAEALARKPDHQPLVLAEKSRAASELASLAEASGRVAVHRIDANRDLDAVRSELRSRLWDVL
jgi:thymidylate kinase